MIMVRMVNYSSNKLVNTRNYVTSSNKMPYMMCYILGSSQGTFPGKESSPRDYGSSSSKKTKRNDNGKNGEYLSES